MNILMAKPLPYTPAEEAGVRSLLEAGGKPVADLMARLEELGYAVTLEDLPAVIFEDSRGLRLHFIVVALLYRGLEPSHPFCRIIDRVWLFQSSAKAA